MENVSALSAPTQTSVVPADVEDGIIVLSDDSKHPWPLAYTAAVSRVLDDAGIPNFIWGDILNAMCGVPFIPTCAESAR